MFFHWISGLAQGLSLKLVKLLLPLIDNNSFLVDPRSLGNTTKELDVIFSVTYNERKSTSSLDIFIVYTFVNEIKTEIINLTDYR